MVTISKLPAKTEEEIRYLIESGGYKDANEFVIETVHRLAEQERALADLRAKIQVGIDQADRGQLIEFTPERSAELFESAKRRFAAGELPSPDVCP